VLRRFLLGLTTALIVARSLLPAEDPGLIDPCSNPLSLSLSVLWLLGLSGWCTWRLWARQPDWYAGAVEAGLLIVVLLLFVSTAATASYQHPAWIVSWEWAGFLAAFVLVRQVARGSAEQRGVFAALLATGVCLAVQSCVQRALPTPVVHPLQRLDPSSWPQLRCQVLGAAGASPQAPFPAGLPWGGIFLALQDDPVSFQDIPLKHNVILETGEAELPLALRLQLESPPAATFTDLDNLAGVLALVLPSLVGCLLAAWFNPVPSWLTGAVLLCVLTVAVALWLARVPSAALPCLLAGTAAAVMAWQRREGVSLASHSSLPPRRLLFLFGLGLLGLLILAFALRPQSEQVFTTLLDQWGADWALVRSHFWLGVGPGLFGRYYPCYMSAVAPEEAWQAANFALEVWASGGVLALLGLAVAVLVFFYRVLYPRGEPRRAGDVNPQRISGGRDANEGGEGIGWEYYEGATVGLLVGFVLRGMWLPAHDLLGEAVMAGGRAVLWFGAFALLRGIRWSPAVRTLACAAGVAAQLLHLSVAGGISVPGVAEPLWIMMALALNGLPEAPVRWGRQWGSRLVPLPLAIAAALLAYLQIFKPVTTAAFLRRDALALAQRYLDLTGGVTTEGGTGKVKEPGKVLVQIVRQLKEAVQVDPGNARLWVDLANWYGVVYEKYPTLTDCLQSGLKCARIAQTVDSLGKSGYLAEASLHLIAARRSLLPDERAQSAQIVSLPLSKIIATHPHDARLHAQLAVALVGANASLARVHATRALALDQLAPTPVRRLTDRQRKQLRHHFRTSQEG
jgi:hypothetical protein